MDLQFRSLAELSHMGEGLQRLAEGARMCIRRGTKYSITDKSSGEVDRARFHISSDQFR